MIGKSWNVSQRIMHGLDKKTHKYLIEPVCGTRHMEIKLHKCFINFTKKISVSKKMAMKGLFHSIKHDCQSTTGHNLRMLMIQYGKNRIEDMDIDMTENKQYEIIPNDEMWRVDFIKELIDIKHGIKVVAEFDTKEIDSLLQFTCIS